MVETMKLQQFINYLLFFYVKDSKEINGNKVIIRVPNNIDEILVNIFIKDIETGIYNYNKLIDYKNIEVDPNSWKIGLLTYIEFVLKNVLIYPYEIDKNNQEIVMQFDSKVIQATYDIDVEYYAQYDKLLKEINVVKKNNRINIRK